jgi:two-component system osmolarity sensor histidine kinase EnvZ
MRWLPATTFGRLLLLLASLLLALMFLIGLAFRAFGVGSGGATYADLIAGNVALARNEAPSSKAISTRLELRHAALAPADARPALLPFQQHIVERLQRYYGPRTQVLFSGKPDSRVWIRLDEAAPAARAWIGVRVPPFVEETIGMTFLFSMIGLIGSIVLAWWFARGLTVPLQRLAQSAPAMSRGEIPDAPTLDRGPREVIALEAALRVAAADVRQSARDREMLLAGVSHDLRTPLARLRVALELQSQIPRSERDALHGDIDEMDAIIAQFLDYVRDGRDEAVQKLELAELIDSAIAEAARAGIAWQRQGVDSVVCNCRPLSLRRALRNLMHNAELHGQPPYAMALETGDGEIRIVVSDAGPGVPAEWLPKAGQPFARADESRGGKPGAGLGLSLVSRVAQMHGGRLALRNRPSGGFEAALVWKPDAG